MSIRLRVVDGTLVALCAARSVEKPGDHYLDDAEHHALAQKFLRDYQREVLMPFIRTGALIEADATALVEREESNNPNREWWDRTYGNEEPA